MFQARRTHNIVIFLTALLFCVAFPVYSQLPGGYTPESFWPLNETEYRTTYYATASGGQKAIRGSFNEITGAPIRVFGGLSVVGKTGDISVSDINSIVDSNNMFFNVSSSNLETLHFGKVLDKTYFTARQKIDNRPVINANVLLRIASNGNVVLWGSDVVQENDYSWNPSISVENACQLLADYAEIQAWQLGSISEVWVNSEHSLVEAYQLRLEGASPLQRPIGLVAADDGEILGYYNDVQHVDIEGTVTGPMLPISSNDDPVMMEFANQGIRVGGENSYTDENGFFLYEGLDIGEDYNLQMQLTGRWVDVNYPHGEDAYYSELIEAPADVEAEWVEPDHGRMDEFNMYYHTDFIHEYFTELDPGFDAMDYPVPATVAFDYNYENAFWGGDRMFFGEGGNTLNNLALFSDVIYHEYTHGVTGFIYPEGVLPYIGQSGALNEAWSDYFPCSIHDHSTLAPGIYVGIPGSPLRDLDNTRSYPENWVGEVHADGLIVGGSMWDVREELGAEYCDSLFHFARYGLANTFVGYLEEVLVVDDDDGDLSNGTPNGEIIYGRFGDHGIGPSEIPNLVLRNIQVTDTNDDHELAAGETVEIQFSVENDVYLFPPPARNVTISAQELDFVEWENRDIELGDIEAGELVNLPQSLRFTVREDVPTLEVHLTITIAANEGDYQVIHRIPLIFGDPRILLVDDGSSPSYRDYYNDAIRNIWTAANTWYVGQNSIPSLDRMNEHDIVIWFTGDRSNPLTLAKISVMQDYVEGGRGLILSGQHISPQFSQYPDFASFLGVAESTDSLQAMAVRGVEGQPLSEGLQAPITGGAGAGNQDSPSGLTASEDAEPLYEYFISGETAAVLKETDAGKVVYFGFGLEGISPNGNSATIGTILLPIINAMGYELDVPEAPIAENSVPSDFRLSSPYPNPFNNTTKISYSLPRTSEIELTVYNLAGRKVMELYRGERAAGSYEAGLNLDGYASGMYLVHLSTPNTSLISKALLIK